MFSVFLLLSAFLSTVVIVVSSNNHFRQEDTVDTNRKLVEIDSNFREQINYVIDKGLQAIGVDKKAEKVKKNSKIKGSKTGLQSTTNNPERNRCANDVNHICKCASLSDVAANEVCFTNCQCPQGHICRSQGGNTQFCLPPAEATEDGCANDPKGKGLGDLIACDLTNQDTIDATCNSCYLDCQCNKRAFGTTCKLPPGGRITRFCLP